MNENQMQTPDPLSADQAFAYWIGRFPVTFETYGDCEVGTSMVNKAFIEIMIAGDANGRREFSTRFLPTRLDVILIAPRPKNRLLLK